MIFKNHPKRRKALGILVIIKILIYLGIAFVLLWLNYFPLHSIYHGYDFQNIQLEKAVTDYILTNEDLVWQMTENGRNFCAIKKLDSGDEHSPLYVFVECEEFTYSSGKLEPHNGFMVPLKITYTGKSASTDMTGSSYDIPHDGKVYGDNPKNLFPIMTRLKIPLFNSEDLRQKLETQAFAYFQSGQNVTKETVASEQWQAIALAIKDCQVKSVSQAHSLDVSVILKNGQELRAVEPNNGDILALVRYNEPTCGKWVSISIE